jgi:hypothetical protein
MIFFSRTGIIQAHLLLLFFIPVAHADIGNPTIAQKPSRLSSPFAATQDFADLSFSLAKFERETVISGAAHITVPEPYSYVLATVSVLGVLAMGTLFRKRKKVNLRAKKRRSKYDRVAKI